MESEELAEAAQIAERFVNETVKYSVSDFERALGEIERQVGTLAYLPKDKSPFGMSQDQKAAISAAAAESACREARRLELAAKHRLSLQEKQAREQRIETRRRVESVVPKSMYLSSQDEFNRFLLEEQQISREFIEEEVRAQQEEDQNGKIDDAASSTSSLASFHTTASEEADDEIVKNDSNGKKNRALPTLVISTISRHNIVDPIGPGNEEPADEMILWTMRCSERKKKKNYKNMSRRK